ncbi:chemotaxis protein CheB [Aliiruegeria lutimaris]|uniref:chemotaxis protein CheB n=1 Tax=Aliiruegeria lutimaris TaxID=571298 RepID=UPI00147E67BD|nr:chemotaxis protein CheB [Aliiruegeria lutimaris]
MAGHPFTVAIGSSAGGLAALKSLFEALPPDLGGSYVVVAHLDPDHASELASILSRHTRMPVVEMRKTQSLQRDHVYVIAPNSEIVATDGGIVSRAFEAPRGRRLPIDRFFRSLAELHHNDYAIVLSGTGSDGSIGVRAIKDAGGFVMVQDPSEAEYPPMPRNAMATGCADIVLPVRELAAKLVELVQARNRLGAQDFGGGDQAVSEDRNELLRRVIAVLRALTGHDFSSYKTPTVERRVARRMQLNNLDSMEDYLELVRTRNDEVEALFGDLLISVTTFFRDPPAFEALAERVIPELLKKPVEDGPVRVWVAGCATGEEVYSLVILILEEAAKRETVPDLQIFATDIDAPALDFAREGLYPWAIEADVSEERLARYFRREGDHYRIKKNVRDLVMFADHSILKDPPFSRLDLVSCRNLLIYLERDIQKRVLATLHYGLNTGGYLFLGSAETADVLSERFFAVDSKARIYLAPAPARRTAPLLQRELSTLASLGSSGKTIPSYPASPADVDFHRDALEESAPPSLLVDANHNVLHLSETVGRFLRLPGGTPSSNVRKIVLPELKLDLGRGLQRVFQSGEATISMPILVKIDGVPRHVVLQVRPVRREDKVSGALVLFCEGAVQDLERATGAEAGTEGTPDGLVARLQEELEIAYKRLRLNQAEFETTNEALRATNEELQSVNQEFHSTSEELETSKEELQSMNEELRALNTELKVKVDSVSQANADLKNLIAATEGGTLFLDTQLRIKLFTAGVGELFNITAGDVGRSITDFTHNLNYDQVAEDAATVLRDHAPKEREVTNERGEWFLLRMRPYRTLEDRIDGVVVTFVDLTELHSMERAYRKANERFRALVNATSYAVYRMSPDWTEMRELDGHGFMRDMTEPSSNWLDEYIDPADQPRVIAAIRQAIQTKSIFELEHRVKRPDGTLGWTLSRAVPMLDETGAIVEWFGAARDTTLKRHTIDELARSRRIESIGRLAGGVAHDFNNLLTIITASIELAQMRVQDEQVRELLDRAAKAADLGASFNARLLSLTGAGVLEPQEMVLNDVVEDMCKLLCRVLDERIELVCDLATDLWPAFVDTGEVQNALLNLVLNARDAIHDSGMITIRTRNGTLDPERAKTLEGILPGDFICLEVADTGTGMSKEVLEQATEAFFSTKTEGTGVGLGLFSVLEFVKRSGGYVDIGSTPDRGTVVCLFLPRSVGTRSAAIGSVEPEAAMQRGNGEVILVVEDNADLRDSTRQRLEALGYKVQEKRTVAEARRLLDSGAGIRLVFSDVILRGDETGVDLARWVRSTKPGIAVLLCSSYSKEVRDLAENGLLGEQRVLSKPYSLAQLARAVSDALQ